MHWRVSVSVSVIGVASFQEYLIPFSRLPCLHGHPCIYGISTGVWPGTPEKLVGALCLWNCTHARVGVAIIHPVRASAVGHLIVVLHGSAINPSIINLVVTICVCFGAGFTL